MKLGLLGILGLFAHTSAQATCSDSPLLGFWLASEASIENDRRIGTRCHQAGLILRCHSNRELEVRWGYQCNTWHDWFYGEKKIVPIENGRLLGQDGQLTQSEFYWDHLIPRHGGTKLELKASGDKISFSIGEDPKHHYPEYTFRGTFRRVSAAPEFLVAAPIFSEEKLHGPWTGMIRVRSESGQGQEVACPIPLWTINFSRYVHMQERIYLPECSEEVNHWLGGTFIRGEGVFDHAERGEGLVRVGTAHANGFHRTHKNDPAYGSMIPEREEITFREGGLTYRYVSRGKEFVMELTRP